MMTLNGRVCAEAIHIEISRLSIVFV